MADYQSLLARAVANLPPSSTAASRTAIYDRARKALVTQLRSLRPPLPESDIAREESALDKAIATVEAKFAAADEAQSAAAAPVEPARRPPPHAPAAPRPPPAPGIAPKSPPPPARPQPAPAVPAPAAPSAAAPERAVEAAPQPGLAPNPAAAASRAAAPAASVARPAEPRATLPVRPSSAAPAPRPPVMPAPPRPSPGPRFEAGGLKPPLVQTPAPGVDGANAPPVVPTKALGEAPPSASLGGVVPGGESQHPAETPVPPVVASRDDEDDDFAVAPDAPLDDDRFVAGRPEAEALRPVAPSAPVERRRSAWPWAALALVVGIVLAVAIAAIVMRQKPQDLAISPAPPAAEAPDAPAKIAQRAQSSPSEAAAPGAAQSPAPSPGADQSQPPAEGAAPAAPPSETKTEAPLPSAARAAMLIASADNPQKPVVNLGSTVWSTVPAPQGQPGGAAIQADADIPDLKMHASMILRKNTDATLQASHTIDLKFTFAGGAPVTGFKDVGGPLMRKEGSAAGEALIAAKANISDVYFLFALTIGEQDLAHNLDLMRSGTWFEFPLLLNDGRIAKIGFEKSADGEAMLEKALDAWK